jgi:chemotaxis protein MotA
MDFTLLIGIIVGIGAILTGFVLEDGVISSLLLDSPIIIVLGGTIGAVIASFALNDILKAFKALKYTFSKKSKGSPALVIETIMMLSDKCRQNGSLVLEEEMNKPIFNNPDFLFLKEGIILILEGRDEEEISYVLESGIRAFTQQKQLEIAVFESAGGFSPTMGVLGTVMGLVTVLSDMGDAESLAASIATAFIATLYGVGIANMIWLPIATKLKSDLKRQKLQMEMMLDGVCMISKGEASRNIKNKLSLYWQAFPGGDKKYKAGIEN